ncbi:MAG: ABC transporter ATP-binding protein [Chloroflexi bacterium]|nr:ABC transporter ATP-binding protein [Chloroflexota bacterium]
MTALLELRNVTKVYSSGMFGRATVTALADVSLAIGDERPTIIAIAGESGSGKTTLWRLLLGVISPTKGQILYNGIDLTNMGRDQRREFRREVQPIFQDPFEVYNPFYPVDHVLAMPVRKFHLAESKRDERRMILDALEMVGLRPDETLGRYPHQLSGGQRQRVMVARSLLLKPRVILADEPVSMVDASLRATILDSIRKMNRELGITVVYITHDLTTAYQVCENIVVLYRGSIAEAGSIERVIKDPKHPYTRLLVHSIPQPNPKRKWGGDVPMVVAGEIGTPQDACKFVDRCPFAMPMCRESAPPLYRITRDQVASCFLYRDAPVLQQDAIGDVLAPAGEPSTPATNGRKAHGEV